MTEQQAEAWRDLLNRLGPTIKEWREKHTNVRRFNCTLYTTSAQPKKGFGLVVTPDQTERSQAND